MKFSINLYPQAGRALSSTTQLRLLLSHFVRFPASPEPKKPRLLMWRLLIFILFKLKQITSFLVNSSALHPINPSTHQLFNPSTLQPINSSTHQLFNPSTHQSLPSGRAGLVVHNAAATSTIPLRGISGYAGTVDVEGCLCGNC